MYFNLYLIYLLLSSDGLSNAVNGTIMRNMFSASGGGLFNNE